MAPHDFYTLASPHLTFASLLKILAEFFLTVIVSVPGKQCSHSGWGFFPPFLSLSFFFFSFCFCRCFLDFRLEFVALLPHFFSEFKKSWEFSDCPEFSWLFFIALRVGAMFFLNFYIFHRS